MKHKKNLSTVKLEYCSVFIIFVLFSDLWKAELAAKQPILKTNDKIRVNLDMYSEKARAGAVSALKQLQCNDDSINSENNLRGLQGSFRKLEVDWNVRHQSVMQLNGYFL